MAAWNKNGFVDDEDHAELLDRQVRGRARRAAAFINAEAVSLVSSNARESARPDTAIDVDNAMSDLPPEQREAVALVVRGRACLSGSR